MLKQKGFSLIELMVVAAVFTIITGAVFTVLIVAEQRYKIESEVLNSFNGANVAMDQLTRDIHQAGYPPANSYAAAGVPAAVTATNVAVPFAWGAGAGYPAAACTMGATCAPAPGNFDIIIEENPDPTAPGATVNWIRYQLPAGSHTLLRAMVPKVAGGDPAAATTGATILVPYLDGVINNATAAEMATIKQYYPNMFPGNAQVPIFTYYCDSTAGTVPCTAANGPSSIREVYITLIVQTSAPDMRNRVPRIVTLTGQAERINPNQ